jgi:aminoglycoside phosphotransferase
MSQKDTNQFNAEEISLEHVSNFINTLGYEVLSIEQQWRNVTAKIRLAERDFFFKLGSTPEISERTLNEASFSNYTNSLKDIPIGCPSVIKTGNYNENSWIIVDWIEGVQLVPKQSKDKQYVAPLENNLSKIVDYLKFLDSQRVTFPLTLDKERIVRVMGKKLEEGAGKFFAQIKEKQPSEDTLSNIENLLTYIRNNINHIDIVLTHNDFVPWHIMIDSQQKLYVIDAEHASFYYNRFHDVATFYHRIFVFMDNARLAESFFETVKTTFNIDSGSTEETQLKLAIALKLVGGYWEAIVQKWGEVDKQGNIYKSIGFV